MNEYEHKQCALRQVHGPHTYAITGSSDTSRIGTWQCDGKKPETREEMAARHLREAEELRHRHDIENAWEETISGEPFVKPLLTPSRLRDLASEIERSLRPPPYNRFTTPPVRLRESDITLLREAADDLETLTNAVDHWPEHPWIPGVFFQHDGPLFEVVAKYRPVS